MKKLAVVVLTLVLAAAIWPGNASAANSLKQGTLGFNVDVNNNAFGLNSDVDNNFVLTGKFFIQNDLAVLAGFGIGIRGADADGRRHRSNRRSQEIPEGGRLRALCRRCVFLQQYAGRGLSRRQRAGGGRSGVFHAQAVQHRGKSRRRLCFTGNKDDDDTWAF